MRPLKKAFWLFDLMLLSFTNWKWLRRNCTDGSFVGGIREWIASGEADAQCATSTRRKREQKRFFLPLTPALVGDPFKIKKLTIYRCTLGSFEIGTERLNVRFPHSPYQCVFYRIMTALQLFNQKSLLDAHQLFVIRQDLTSTECPPKKTVERGI